MHLKAIAWRVAGWPWQLLNYLHWPALLALWASLFLQRLQLLEEMNLDLPAAWEQGLGLGIHADLVASLIPVVMASMLAWLVALPRALGFVLCTAAVWIATWANMMYYGHFGMPLDWWVIEFHTGDIGDVSGFIFQLSWSWRIPLSILLVLGACAAFGRSEWNKGHGAAAARGRSAEPVLVRLMLRPLLSALDAFTSAAFWKLRLWGVPASLGLVLGFFVVQQSPRLFHIYGFPNPVNAHIIQVWYQQRLKSRPYSGVSSQDALAFGQRSQSEFSGNPADLMARYRDFRDSEWRGEAATQNDHARDTAAAKPQSIDHPGGRAMAKTALTTSALPPSAGNAGTGGAQSAGQHRWPLLRRFDPDPERTRQARRMLGLPEQGPVHVVLLMVESLRDYDVMDPEIGPQVFPRLRAIMKKRAIRFSQAYTASISAGQTVRGSFTTLCSFLPNIVGPATYLAYPTVRIRCLPEVMKENGYVTLWFNSHRANSHNKQFFEGGNGVDHFYDKRFFLAKGVRERIGEWGLGDNPVLQETLRKMVEWAGKDQGPLYVQIVTVSTHGPVRKVESIRFDDAFEKATSNHKRYRDYMTMFRYTDEAIGDFLDGLFASPMADNTVVLLLGDHAHAYMPHHPMTQVQRADVPFRTPLAIISKNIPRPMVLDGVVHQVDVAPTAALIAGASGEVTWLGRALLPYSGEGSPFVYANANGFFWRTNSRGCYNRLCFDLREKDPSIDKRLPVLPEQTRLDKFFRQVVEAGGILISTNRISPRN
ncbi:MAG: LTA synthase family protein [SAR324 cluster bacterium]|nr:LTA synthase family protein [SAR324 cluster bacterium]